MSYQLKQPNLSGTSLYALFIRVYRVLRFNLNLQTWKSTLRIKEIYTLNLLELASFKLEPIFTFARSCFKSGQNRLKNGSLV